MQGVPLQTLGIKHLHAISIALFRIVFGMNVQQSLTNEHVEAFRAPGICRPFYIDTG